MTNSTSTKEHAMTGKNTTAERGYVRPVLWLLLVISGVANVVTSASIPNVLVGIGFGLLTMVFGTALVVHHYRHRRD
ncbi:hypothetical protein ORV05_22680 [Amycolatopsis cynarae]|uniref:Uncharacterized protein n=1 Tax=Amycolatopsis cynarae TaxID=2995223 RepID=A0ABY7AVQ6_9PSEU|nr:hypothetical protein [Amycolatopsis sp. HUAS 11-8]WAL63794.1 hypothetical protein ORV05_22680 [Amycolatopsis sp. HUAS 11-8]